MNLIEWEQLHRDDSLLQTTYRAKVIGGWIVRYREKMLSAEMVFISDPNHLWLRETTQNALREVLEIE